MAIQNVPTQRLSIPTPSVSGRPLHDTKSMKLNLLVKTAEAIQEIGNDISNRYSENQYDKLVTDFEQNNARMFEEQTQDINKFGEFKDNVEKGFKGLEKEILKNSKNLNPAYTKRLKKYLLNKSTDNLTKAISAASVAERAVLPGIIKQRSTDILINANGKHPDDPFMAEVINNFRAFVNNNAPVIGQAQADLHLHVLNSSLEQAWAGKTISDPEGNYGQFLDETYEDAPPQLGLEPYQFKYLTGQEVNILRNKARGRLTADIKAKKEALKEITTATNQNVSSRVKQLKTTVSVVLSNISGPAATLNSLEVSSKNIKKSEYEVGLLEELLANPNTLLKDKDRIKLTTDINKLNESIAGSRVVYTIMYNALQDRDRIIEEINNGTRDSVPQDWASGYEKELIKLSGKYALTNPTLSKVLGDAATTLVSVSDKIETAVSNQVVLQNSRSTDARYRKGSEEKLVNNHYRSQTSQVQGDMLKKINDGATQVGITDFNKMGRSLLQIENNPLDDEGNIDKDFWWAMLPRVKNQVVPVTVVRNLINTIEQVDPKDPESTKRAVNSLLVLERLGSSEFFDHPEILDGTYAGDGSVTAKAMKLMQDWGQVFKKTEQGRRNLAKLLFQESDPASNQAVADRAAELRASILDSNVTSRSNKVNVQYAGDNKRTQTFHDEIIKKFNEQNKSWFNFFGWGHKERKLSQAQTNAIFNATRGLMVVKINQKNFDLSKYEGNVWDTPLFNENLKEILSRVSHNPSTNSISFDGIYSPKSTKNYMPAVVQNNFATSIVDDPTTDSNDIKKLLDEGILVRTKLADSNSLFPKTADLSHFPHYRPEKKIPGKPQDVGTITHYPTADSPLIKNYPEGYTVAQYERSIGLKRRDGNNAWTFGPGTQLVKIGEERKEEEIGANKLTFEEWLIIKDQRNDTNNYETTLENSQVLQEERRIWASGGTTTRAFRSDVYALTKNGERILPDRTFSMTRSRTDNARKFNKALAQEDLQKWKRKTAVYGATLANKPGMGWEPWAQNLVNSLFKFITPGVHRESLEQQLKLIDLSPNSLGMDRE